MKIMKDLWEEKGHADLGFTSQHLRDQAAKLEKSVGNVRDLISVSVGSRENQNMSSTGEINDNCVVNFQNANSSNIANLHTAERVLIPEEQVNTLNEETRVLVDGAALVLARVNMQEGEFIDREIDTRIKEKPTNNDLVNINRAIVELMQQHHISPTENPFSYQWVANSVLYSVVTVFLLQKGWKKQGPRSLRRVDNGRGKRDYMAQVGEIRKKISIPKAELERVRINGKLTKKGKRNRAMLKEECKDISVAELVSYMEKQKSLLRKLERGFYRRQKHEEARRVNHQFKVDVGQVYANMREVLNKDKENEHPKYAPADNKNAEGKMFENVEDASSFWIQLWKSQGTGNRNAQWLEDIRSPIYSRVPPPSENTWKLDTTEATKVLARKKN